MDVESNYGVKALTKDLLSNLTATDNTGSNNFWGPVIEKGGKYYVTSLKENVNPVDAYYASQGDNFNYEDYYGVSMVIDKSVNPDDAERVIRNYDHSKKASESKVDDVSQYLKEVESATGKEVGYVDLKEDNKLDLYNVDGDELITDTTMKKRDDPNSVNQYDVLDVVNKVGVTKKVSATDKLDDENKAVIENYLSDASGLKDVEIIKNDKGEYVAISKETTIVDGKEVVETKELVIFSKDATLQEAINDVNKLLNEEEDLLKKAKRRQGLKTYKLSPDQVITIDVLAFEQIQKTNKNAGDLVKEAKTNYKPAFTEKLLAEYNSLSGANKTTTKLNESIKLITSLNSSIQYSLKIYENVDNHLAVILNSVISEIFAINSKSIKKINEEYGSNYKDREKALDDLIDNLTNRLDGLKKEYTDIATLFNGIGYGFNLFDFDNSRFVRVDGKSKNNFDYVLPYSNLNKVFELIEKNDLITKLKAYSEGKSWKESGLSEVYRNLPGVMDDIPDDKQDKLYENTFLKRYLSCQFLNSKEKKTLNQGFYTTSASVLNMSDEDVNVLKSHMAKQLEQYNTDLNIILGDKANKKLSSKDLADFYKTDIESYEQNIATTSTTIQSYKQYKLLMPYDAEMQGDLYLEYLTQDYNDLNLEKECPELIGKIQYMSQQEIALYCMYKGIKLKNQANPKLANDKTDKAKADGYLNAMDDLLNRRKGYEEAVLRFQSYNGNPFSLLASAKDGFTDGLEGFFRSIANAFAADGKPDATDYRDLYFMSMLKDDKSILEGIDGVDKLSSAEKAVLKRNYSTWKGVGSAIIPTAASFIPTVGSTVSRTLWFASSFGSSRESALQQGAGGAEALLYSGLSALTSTAMNKLMSGIAGLNGQAPPQSVSQFLLSMGKQGGRVTAGMFVDSIYRSAILGTPVDLSKIPSEAFDAAITGALTAGLMNGMTKLSIKLADGLVFKFSDKYNSYAELKADIENQFKNSDLGQKLERLKAIGGSLWDRESVKYKDSIVGKWLKSSDDPNKKSDHMNMTEDAEKILGPNIKLKDNQSLIFDTKRKDYYIIDNNNGTELKVPAGWLNTREGDMHIVPTDEQYEFGAKLRYGDDAVNELRYYRLANNGTELSYYRFARNEIPNLLNKNYGVSLEEAQKIAYKFRFISGREEWLKLMESRGYSREVASNIAGIHCRSDGQNYVWLNFEEMTEGDIKHNTIHEYLHAVGRLGTASGLNESTTEKLATDISVQKGYVTGSNAYRNGVEAVEKLMNSNIPGLEREDFLRAYFNTNSESDLRQTVDGIMGNGYYDNDLKPAFDLMKGKVSLNLKDANTLNNSVNNIINKYNGVNGVELEPTFETPSHFLDTTLETTLETTLPTM